MAVRWNMMGLLFKLILIMVTVEKIFSNFSKLVE